MPKFKRSGVWYGRVKVGGKWISKTLNTSDSRVADARYRDLERRYAVPAYAAAYETTLKQAADEFVTSRRVKGCAEDTIGMYKCKLGHWLRILGPDRPLASVQAPEVDRFVAQRLSEGTHRSTIGKELTAIRGLLRVAKRAKKYPFDLDEVLPVEWSNEYEPRRTALTVGQVRALVERIASPSRWVDARGREYERNDPMRLNRASTVAFLVATGARWGEACRATLGQINLVTGLVYFQISKTKKKGKREKWVPITPATRPLLEAVVQCAEAEGRKGRLFEPWTNVRRDLEAACEALGIPKVSPNDLRRTHSNWLRDAGVDSQTIADVLGHTDTRMVEKVYGKLRPEQIRARVLAATGVH